MARDHKAEQQLINRMRSGDASAVADLAAAYGPKIYQLAFRYMRNREDAEEIVQDVLMKVFRKIGAFGGRAALSSWIYRITFNSAMSRLRSGRHSLPADRQLEEANRDGSPLKPREVADWSGLADDEVMRVELRERLVEAIRELPQIYRVPVILRDVQGLSTEEASAILHIKTQTLKSRLHRGRLVLRERLGDFASGLSLHQAA